MIRHGETALVTFTFFEPPASFTTEDVSVAAGVISHLSATSDPKVFTATFIPDSATVSLANTINVHGLSDGAISEGETFEYPQTFKNPSATAFDGNIVWVANYDNNSVARYILSTHETSVYTGIGSHPIAIILAGSYVWTANQGDNTVSRIGSDGAVTNFSVPVSSPSVLATDGTNVWVGSSADSRFAIISPSGAVTGFSAHWSPATGITGFAWSGTYMWAVGSGYAYKIATDGTYTQYSGIGVAPKGLVFDGTNMWTGNSLNSGGLTRISPSGTLTQFATASGVFPYSIVYDGTYLWASDPLAYKMLRMSPSGTPVVYSYGASMLSLTGLSGNATGIWAVDFGRNAIYKIATNGTIVNFIGVVHTSSGFGLTYDGTRFQKPLGDSFVSIDSTGKMYAESGNIDVPFFERSSFPPNDGVSSDGNYWLSMGPFNGVTKISPDGTKTHYAVGALGIASDSTYVYATDITYDRVYKIPKNPLSGSPSAIPGTTGSFPRYIASDGTNIWTSNGIGSSISKLLPSGVVATYSLDFRPYKIVCQGGYVWLSSENDPFVARFNPGTNTVDRVYTTPAINKIFGIDGINIWTAGEGNVSRIAPDGSRTDFSFASTIIPEGLVFDGENMRFFYYNETSRNIGLKTFVVNSGFSGSSANYIVDTNAFTYYAVNDITETSATITWGTEFPSAGTVEYGLDESYGSTLVNEAATLEHFITIGDLASCTQYYFRVTAVASGQSVSTEGGSFISSCPQPTIEMSLYNVRAVNSGNDVQIYWESSQPGTGKVQYGPTIDYGSEADSREATSAPSIAVTGLTECSTYHYRVNSDAGGGVSAWSEDNVFYTNCREDQISEISSSVAGRFSEGVYVSDLSVGWHTTNSLTSKIYWGIGSDPTSVFENAYLTTSHSVTITGLPECQYVNYYVVSEFPTFSLQSDVLSILTSCRTPSMAATVSVSGDLERVLYPGNTIRIDWHDDSTNGESNAERYPLGFGVFADLSVFGHELPLGLQDGAMEVELLAVNNSCGTPDQENTYSACIQLPYFWGEKFQTTRAISVVIRPHYLGAEYEAVYFSSQEYTMLYGTFPSAPVITGTSTGDGAVSFTIDTDPTYTGGSPIMNYQVEYRISSLTGQWTVYGTNISPGGTITVSGLENGTSYDFFFAAVNIFGPGERTYFTSVFIPTLVPSAPTDVFVSSGDENAVLSWTAPSVSNDPSLFVTDYLIEYKKSENFEWLVFLDGVSTATSTTITNLINGTSYDFRVSALNVAGTGDASSVVVATPARVVQVGQPPGAVLIPSKVSVAYVENIKSTENTGSGSSSVSKGISQFTIDMRLGTLHPEVKMLQKFLNLHGYVVAKKGPGSPGNETDKFGPATKAALAKFQKNHALYVLTPAGLSSPTGIFGNLTRNFINRYFNDGGQLKIDTLKPTQYVAVRN